MLRAKPWSAKELVLMNSVPNILRKIKSTSTKYRYWNYRGGNKYSTVTLTVIIIINKFIYCSRILIKNSLISTSHRFLINISVKICYWKFNCANFILICQPQMKYSLIIAIKTFKYNDCLSLSAVEKLWRIMWISKLSHVHYIICFLGIW